MNIYHKLRIKHHKKKMLEDVKFDREFIVKYHAKDTNIDEDVLSEEIDKIRIKVKELENKKGKKNEKEVDGLKTEAVKKMEILEKKKSVQDRIKKADMAIEQLEYQLRMI